MRLDFFDLQLFINILSTGSLTKGAERSAISLQAASERIKKLEQQEYILGYHAHVNFKKLEKAHIAFVQISLSDTRAKALDQFNSEVSKLEAVEQCHMIAGNFDYLLKVRTNNINTYRLLLSEKISSLPNVASTSTFVSMENVKD